MRILTVKVQPDYDILIGQGLLEKAGEVIRKLGNFKKIAVISDSTVLPLYGETLQKSLLLAGFSVCSYAFPAGERSKNLSTLSQIYSFLAREEITRSDLIVALGGGVVGDITGFASASYLRGVPFVQIPTTLLAMVDSSVGGKTGVDILEGKNLVGAFHQPILVVIDTDALKTLPEEEIKNGMGEVIKYAAIESLPLFESLEKGDKISFEDIIEQSLKVKISAVEQDPFDQGVRQMLNFGHTLGHAIELSSNFSIPHGEAVAIGMCMITEFSEKEGLTESGSFERLKSLVQKYNLPTSFDKTLPELFRIARCDKKRKGGEITLVLLQKIGQYKLQKFPLSQLTEGSL